MNSIGVIGTAKNTGKTTTLTAILNNFRNKGNSVAITGIGYDGEGFDNITYLPKPRLLFNPGEIIATAENCINASPSLFEIISGTEIDTPLGEVLIARIKTKGLAVIAGPNTRTGLEKLLNRLKELKPDKIIIDGSLNRLSPMSLADKLIIATGASRSIDIPFLSAETGAMEKIFNLPIANNSPVVKEFQLLLDTDDADIIAQSNCNEVKITGMVSEKGLITLFNRVEGISIILNSPISLLLAGEPIELLGIVDKAKERGNKICFVHSPELIAITVNPFYAEQHNYSYRAAYLNKTELIESIRERVSLPVYNIFEDQFTL